MESLIWMASQLIASLMLPPGVFFILIAVGLIWRRKRRWARWLVAVALAAFLLLTLNVVGRALLAPIEERWPPLDPQVVTGLAHAETMIVVLGGGRTAGALEYAERETLAAASLRRTVFAAQLAARTGFPLAVTGGTPGGGALSEAMLMKNLLEKGFRQRVELVEDASLNTHESALHMARSLGERRIKTVVLVTDVLHMPRAVRSFEATGLKVVPAPMHFRASSPLSVHDFVPSVEALELSRNVIREWVGALWYWMRGY